MTTGLCTARTVQQPQPQPAEQGHTVFFQDQRVAGQEAVHKRHLDI